MRFANFNRRLKMKKLSLLICLLFLSLAVYGQKSDTPSFKLTKPKFKLTKPKFKGLFVSANIATKMDKSFNTPNQNVQIFANFEIEKRTTLTLRFIQPISAEYKKPFALVSLRYRVRIL